jgi:4-aminobutyrate aminotransferase
MNVLSAPTANPDQTTAADLRRFIPPVLGRYTDLVVRSASGSWIETEDGDRYLDYSSGIGVTNTGHCHPKVVAAIQEQAAHLLHGQANIVYHRPGLELSAELARRVPGEDNLAFLTNSGAEAIEGAVKLAKYATRRPAVIAFEGGFHGRTMGALSLTSSRVSFRGHYEPTLPSVYFAPYADPLHSPGGRNSGAALRYSLDGLQKLFDHLVYPDDVACMLVEPIQGEGGYIVPPDGFLAALRELCDKYGILLVIDEVQTGFGRTGRFWAFEHEGVRPDITVMAMGIASGLPLAAIVSSRELMTRWGTGAHGGTYGGNAVACAAALAGLRVIDEEGLVANAAARGDQAMQLLSDLPSRCRGVADLRGRGLMIALEFTDSDGKPDGNLTKEVLHDCLEEHLILISCGAHGEVVRLVPPLVTTSEEMEHACAIVRRACLERAG